MCGRFYWPIEIEHGTCVRGYIGAYTPSLIEGCSAFVPIFRAMCSGPKALGPDVSVCKRELQASSWALLLSTPQPSLKILPCSTQESTLPDFWLFVPGNTRRSSSSSPTTAMRRRRRSLRAYAGLMGRFCPCGCSLQLLGSGGRTGIRVEGSGCEVILKASATPALSPLSLEETR